MKSILLYLWQLPQNLVGLLLLGYFKMIGEVLTGDIWFDENKVPIYQSCSMRGAISLGNYIICQAASSQTVLHEYGHQIQSRYLGPLYLLVIGLPSIIWASLYGRVITATKNGYYKFYTERWADKLAKINRE